MAWVNIVGSENRLKGSQDQSSAVWQELGGAVKTANVVAGPDGSISGGKVACFIFVINLFDLNGSVNLIKKDYKVESLIEFPGH